MGEKLITISNGIKMVILSWIFCQHRSDIFHYVAFSFSVLSHISVPFSGCEEKMDTKILTVSPLLIITPRNQLKHSNIIIFIGICLKKCPLSSRLYAQMSHQMGNVGWYLAGPHKYKLSPGLGENFTHQLCSSLRDPSNPIGSSSGLCYVGATITSSATWLLTTKDHVLIDTRMSWPFLVVSPPKSLAWPPNYLHTHTCASRPSLKATSALQPHSTPVETRRMAPPPNLVLACISTLHEKIRLNMIITGVKKTYSQREKKMNLVSSSKFSPIQGVKSELPTSIQLMRRSPKKWGWNCQRDRQHLPGGIPGEAPLGPRSFVVVFLVSSPGNETPNIGRKHTCKIGQSFRGHHDHS